MKKIKILIPAVAATTLGSAGVGLANIATTLNNNTFTCVVKDASNATTTYTYTYNSTDKTCILKKCVSDQTTVTIPKTTVNPDDGETYTVVGIGTKAFYKISNSVTDVIYPASIASIGDWAFYKCSKIKTITVDNDATAATSLTLGENVFAGCTSLTKVEFKFGILSAINQHDFDGCTSLTTISNKDSTSILSRIEAGAFNGCSNLKPIDDDGSITGDVTYIGPSAFKGCTNFTKFTSNAKLEYVGELAFSGAYKNFKLNYVDEVDRLYWTSSQGKLLKLSTICDDGYFVNECLPSYTRFNKITSLTTKVKDKTTGTVKTNFETYDKPVIQITTTPSTNVTTLFDYSVSPAGRVEIDETTGEITKINSTGDVTVTITPDQGEIASTTSYECKFTIAENHITNISIDQTGPISLEAPATKQFTATVTVEEGYEASTDVEWSVTAEDGSATDVASISSTGLLTGLKTGTVKVVAKPKYNPIHSSTVTVNVIFETLNIDSSGTLHGFKDGTTKYDILSQFPDGVITIPKQVTAIADEAFCGHFLDALPEEITEIKFEGNNCKTIGANAFKSLYGDVLFMDPPSCKITLPSSIESIGAGAFSNNYIDELEIVNLENTKVTYIPEDCFKNAAIYSITLPANVTNIGDNAFYNTLLQSITIPSKVIKIGAGAFDALEDTLTSVTFEDTTNPLVVDHNTSITWTPTDDDAANATFIKNNATIALDKVEELPSELQWSENYSNQIDVPTGTTLPETLVIPQYAYKDGTITEIKTIGDSFAKHTEIKKLVLPENITGNIERSFNGCTNLAEVVLPKNIGSLYPSSFMNCSSLKVLDFSQTTFTTKGWYSSNFYNDTNIELFKTSEQDSFIVGSSVFANMGKDVEGGCELQLLWDDLILYNGASTKPFTNANITTLVCHTKWIYQFDPDTAPGSYGVLPDGLFNNIKVLYIPAEWMREQGDEGLSQYMQDTYNLVEAESDRDNYEKWVVEA